MPASLVARADAEGAETTRESAEIRSAVFDVDDPRAIVGTERWLQLLTDALAASHVITAGKRLQHRLGLASPDPYVCAASSF